MFRWIGRVVHLTTKLCCYLGGILCLACLVLVGGSVFRALDSPPGRVVATSLVVSGKTGFGLLPWWFMAAGGILTAWLWWTHKILGSIVMGCVTGVIVALVLLT